MLSSYSYSTMSTLNGSCIPDDHRAANISWIDTTLGVTSFVTGITSVILNVGGVFDPLFLSRVDLEKRKKYCATMYSYMAPTNTYLLLLLRVSGKMP